MTDVVQRKIVLARPEERHRVEPLAAAEYVACRRLSLAFGHHPMLDANIVARERIGPACDVSSGEDPGNAGLEILVYPYAVIGFYPRPLGKIGQRLDADPDHNEVGVDRLAVLERDLAFAYRGNTLLQMEQHTVAFVQTPQIFAHLRSESPFHRHRLGRDDVDLELSLNQGSRNLHRNETRPYQHDSFSPGGLANDHAAITQRAQVANMRRVLAGNLEPHGLGAHREEQGIKFALTAVGQRDVSLHWIDGGDPSIQQQFDLALAVEVHRAQWDPLLRRATGKKVLRQIWPVIRNGLIRADHRDAARISLSPQHFRGGITCGAASHDDDVLRRLGGPSRPFLGRLLFAHEEFAAAGFNLP